MKPVRQMSLEELAAYISSHLYRSGVEVVLSGGSCVAVYSAGQYVSMDLDLINRYQAKRSLLQSAMTEIGFSEQNRYFKHPDTEYLVEFPAGPLAVGEEPVETVEELTTECGVLKLLTPTDCVKDRLAAFYHWEDRQGLEQAVLVAKNNKVNLSEVRRWSVAEGKGEEFKRFASALSTLG